MIELDDAWAQLKATLPAPQAEECLPLSAALGRILSEAPRASHAVPPFPASAMDGYACRAVELAALGEEGLAVGREALDRGPTPGKLRPHLHWRTGAVRVR